MTITTAALQEDVDAGRAAKVGEGIRKNASPEPHGVFYEKVARRDPAIPAPPKRDSAASTPRSGS